MGSGSFSVLLVAIVLVSASCAGAGQDTSGRDSVTVKFPETDALLRNPGRGWMAFHRLPAATARVPYSVGYFRWDWGDIEPEEGRRTWKPIDDALAAWAKAGGSLAFRIMTTNAHSRGYYCSPKWLFDAGCRSFDYVRGGEDTMEGGQRIPRIEPDYSDPLYLSKHGAFLEALAGRYDGHPNVEFLDIGSYGIWGEWHTSHPAGVAVRQRIIDLYLAAFRKTPLVMMSDDAELLDYALSKGAGFRRDGVGSPWHEQNWIGSKKYAKVRGFAEAWKKAPAVFEWFGPFDFMERRGWPFDRAVRFMLDNHVTFINDNLGQVPGPQMPRILDLARRAGYRFVLRELSHPASAEAGGSIQVTLRWSNVGVGRLYRRFPLMLYLLDAAGKAAVQVEAKADSRGWLPGDHHLAEALPIPAALSPGTYTFGLALVDLSTGRPAIALAIGAAETDRLYRLSQLTVRPRAARGDP